MKYRKVIEAKHLNAVTESIIKFIHEAKQGKKGLKRTKMAIQTLGYCKKTL